MAFSTQHSGRVGAHGGNPTNNFNNTLDPIGSELFSTHANVAELNPPTLIHRFQHDNSILALTVSKNYIFAGTQRGEIIVYTLHTYERVKVIQAHNKSVLCLTLSEDERFVFSGGADRFVNVWELPALKHLASLYSCYDIGDIYCVAYSQSSGFIYLGVQNSSIQWYDFSDYESRPMPDPQSHPSMRQDRFFDSTGPGGVRTPRRQSANPNGVNVRTGRSLEIDKENVKLFAHFGFVYCMLLADKKCFGSATMGQETLISGGSDGNIKLWKLDEEKVRGGKIEEIGELNEGTERMEEKLDSVLSLAVDGTLLYSGRKSGEVNVWDLESRQLLRAFNHSESAVMALAVGNGLVFTSDIKGLVKKFNQSYDCLSAWQAHDGKVLASVFTRYHNRPMYVTGANDSTIGIWDTGDSAPLPPAAFRASQEQILDSLRDFISYRTVSSDDRLQVDCRKGASFLRSLLKGFGATTDLINTDDGCNPIVYGRFHGKAGSAKPKKTTLFYGHYDVIPADNQRKKWISDPFTMTGRNGYVYGRGVSDNKGPIIAAIYAVAELVSYKALEQDIVFLIEGEEESGSRGFIDAIRRNKSLIGQVDWILLANSYWLDDEVPCLTYGLRGVIRADIDIRSNEPNLHSGVDGSRLLDEPLKDLVALVSKLSGRQGHVQIPGFYDSVPEVTDAEEVLYADITKCLVERDPNLGPPEALATSLMKRWRDPSMTVHGFKTTGPNNTTIIPQAAQTSLSFRLVPNQEVEVITKAFKDFLRSEYEEMGSKNEMFVTIKHQAEPWLGDYTNIIFQALEKAVKEVWSLGPPRRRTSTTITSPRPILRSPVATSATLALSSGAHIDSAIDAAADQTTTDTGNDAQQTNSPSASPTLTTSVSANAGPAQSGPQKLLFIREGGSIPAVRFLEREFSAPAAHLPCGQASDNAHLDNERFRILNLWNSKEVFRRVFAELPQRAAVAVDASSAPELASPTQHHRELRGQGF